MKANTRGNVKTSMKPRPTLVRRVVLALLLAFAVIFALNLAAIYWQVTGQAGVDARLRTRAQTLLAAVDGAATAAEARAVAAAVDAILNPSAPTSPLLAPGNPRHQRQGGVLVVLADAAGAQPGGSAADAWHQGHAMRVYRAVSKRWSVTIGEPAWNPGRLLLTISRDMGVYLVLAFLLVLGATWLAVARGLRPLRRLSDTIAARGPDDLRPLGANGVHAVHAELAPLVAAIDRMLAQLRGKLETERGFVQDAAHELRTPLAVISAQAHVLAASPVGDARAGAERDMDRAIERASRLIRQLLALARIDSAPAHESRAVDVALVVRHELALLAPAAMARAIELELESPDVLMHAVDVPALQSIVQNLLANAIGYCGKGAQVVVGLGVRGDVLTLSVADDGPGIAPAEQGEVFERFRRGSGHDAPGSGLGLAIVRQAAARMGGTVRLEAGLRGKGCAFVTELPGPGWHGPG
jgi:two-component system sensor histidine kinase QseC